MANLAIKAENISKQYRLGQIGTGTISHDLNRFWSKFRGKEDPYLKIGDANDRTSKGTSDWAYAWVPVVGPIVGAVLAALLFRVL